MSTLNVAKRITAWNNGVYPFFPKDLKYLSLAVGYAKELDTALVEVTDITFRPLSGNDGKPVRFHDDGENVAVDPNGELCLWETVFHLGKIVDVKRK